MFGLQTAGARPFLRATGAAALLVLATWVPSASASPGYELDPVTPFFTLEGKLAQGIAIDQASQALYVAEGTVELNTTSHGLIEQFNTSGVPTANSPFVTGSTDYYTGVAVNPVTQGIYAYQTRVTTPVGDFGVARMDTFSSTGAQGPSFTPGQATLPQLAADSLGRVYFPNDNADAVQVFNASGELKDTITCGACPGGPFSEPNSVALDSASNLYVVDLADGGRVIKFKPIGGTYAYSSVLQSGENAGAVGVDPANNNVFVGSVGDDGYHIVAYDSSGAQFDDFGTETFDPPLRGSDGAGEIAVSESTHKVYVVDSSASVVRIFVPVASIPAPTAITSSASVGQLEAELEGDVNPNGHGLTDCHFEYTDDADFQLNDFTNASSVPCTTKPGGTVSTPVVAQIQGLTPATTYDFRVAVTSNGGSAKGSAQDFTTLPPLAPSVTTGSASALTQTTATIGGSVNPHGGPISDCHFEYTDDADFQSNNFTNAISAPCLFKPSGVAATSVSAKITGLSAGTNYRFRAVATNNSGTTKAVDQGFATLAETCATNPALCPPPPTKTPQTPAPPAQPPPTTTPPAEKPLKCRKGFKKKKVHGKAKCVKVRRHRKR